MYNDEWNAFFIIIEKEFSVTTNNDGDFTTEPIESYNDRSMINLTCSLLIMQK